MIVIIKGFPLFFFVIGSLVPALQLHALESARLSLCSGSACVNLSDPCPCRGKGMMPDMLICLT
ncbi:MAG: hypothetical protein K2I87_00135, partial [Bacteroidales bacterium]|nr:hypothetical protein [Bacteroidales bacterium]